MSIFDRLSEKKGPLTTKADAIGSIRKYFDDIEYKYDYIEKDSAIITGFMGDDLPIRIGIYIGEETIVFRSVLDLCAQKNNYPQVLEELNRINASLVFGMFFLDTEDGFIIFEYGFPYNDARLSPDFFLGFLRMIIKTVDDHDGDLKKIAEERSADEYWSMYR